MEFPYFYSATKAYFNITFGEIAQSVGKSMSEQM